MNLIVKALQTAEKVHNGEVWRQSKRPMIYHAIGVASLVLRHGGTEAQAAAALLHDAYGRFEEKFESDIQEILEGFTDPPVPKEAERDWAFCKKKYLEKISTLPEHVLFVIVCEELHEIAELVQDLRNEGVGIWKRYPVPDRDITWYFRKITEIAYKRLSGKYDGLVQELSRWTRELTESVHEGS